MSKLSAVTIVVLFSLSLFASMIGNNIQSNDDVLTESEDVFETQVWFNQAIGCQGSTTHYVELKGPRWYEIGPLEGHADSWFEYQSMETLRSGDENLSFDLFTGCLYLGESYMVEWNLTMDSQIVDSGFFLWAQTQELRQFRVETSITYPDAAVDEYTLSASIKEWHRPTATYVSGQGFTHTVEMPYSNVLVEDIDETECSQNANKTLHYEVLYNRVFEPGDFFVGGIQVICPLFDTEYSIDFWFGHESGSADYFGSIPFNFSSTDNDYEYYPIFNVLESDGYQLNVTGEWHFYTTLYTYNDTFGGFYDIVGPDTSKDIRDLFFVNQTGPVLESLEDTDGVPYFLDLCLFTPWQAWGNVSESGCDETYNGDVDFDGVPNKFDLCPDTESNSSVDLSGCSPNYNLDSDGDSFIDRYDRFPQDSNEWLDSDGDGIGDNSDPFPNDPSESVDTDGDGVGDNNDFFPTDACAYADNDGDGLPDTIESDCTTNLNEDLDDDGDGVLDVYDAFPLDATETTDTDNDGIGNNVDTDDDGDTWHDTVDWAPLDSTEWLDSDGDGVGDNGDWAPNDVNESKDSDGDGVGDNADVFPTDASETIDSDADGLGNNADLDDDNDRLSDENEAKYGTDPLNNDSDGDGYLDGFDDCPMESWSMPPQGTIKGCIDTDQDGISDPEDNCPLESGTSWKNTIGCPDKDGDGYADSLDAYPDDPSAWSNSDDDDYHDGIDACQDKFGTSTVDRLGCPDRDGDGFSDQNDIAPDDPYKNAPTRQLVHSALDVQAQAHGGAGDCGLGSDFEVDYSSNITATLHSGSDRLNAFINYKWISSPEFTAEPGWNFETFEYWGMLDDATYSKVCDTGGGRPQITIDEDGGIHALFMSWDKEDDSYGSDEYPWEDGCWACTQGKQGGPDKGLWYVHWNPSTGSWKEHKISSRWHYSGIGMDVHEGMIHIVWYEDYYRYASSTDGEEWHQVKVDDVCWIPTGGETLTADGAGCMYNENILIYTGTEDVENHLECAVDTYSLFGCLEWEEVDRREEFFWDGWGDEGDYKWGSCDEAKKYGYTCEEIIERGYSCAECDCAGEGNEHFSGNGQTAGEQRWNTHLSKTVPTGIDVAVGTNPDDSSQYRVHVVYGQYAFNREHNGQTYEYSFNKQNPPSTASKTGLQYTMMNEDDIGFGPSRSLAILGHEETDISYSDFDPTPDICASYTYWQVCPDYSYVKAPRIVASGLQVHIASSPCNSDDPPNGIPLYYWRACGSYGDHEYDDRSSYYQVSGVNHYGEVSGWRTDDDYNDVYQVLKGLVVYSSLDGGSNWGKKYIDVGNHNRVGSYDMVIGKDPFFEGYERMTIVWAVHLNIGRMVNQFTAVEAGVLPTSDCTGFLALCEPGGFSEDFAKYVEEEYCNGKRCSLGWGWYNSNAMRFESTYFTTYSNSWSPSVTDLDRNKASMTGVGITTDEFGYPILIHGHGDYDDDIYQDVEVDLFLTGMDLDGDGFANWEDYCPTFYGLSTDSTPGCIDENGDGITDKTESDDDGSLPHVSGFSTILCVILAVVFVARRDKKSDD